jgi:hypothetical protein
MQPFQAFGVAQLRAITALPGFATQRFFDAVCSD